MGVVVWKIRTVSLGLKLAILINDKGHLVSRFGNCEARKRCTLLLFTRSIIHIILTSVATGWVEHSYKTQCIKCALL